MKLYRIVKRKGVWQVLAGEPEHAISAGDDRDSLITLARKIAARHDGEVYVSDEAGNLEIVYLYVGGAESVRYPCPPRLRLVGD